ncbi:MAG: S8 family serine peptidase [Clostridia bacterium]|nr:S8 family serine peptidase [Clostridia bacterium]
MRRIFNKRVIFFINIITVLIVLLTCSIVYSSKAKTSTSLTYKKSMDEQSYIIELKGNSAIDQVKNMNNASKLLDFEQNVLKKQSSIISEIENITGNKISNQTGILLNTISIMATCEEIERIKYLNEVIDIQKNVVYESADTKTKQNYTIDEYKDILKVREDATGLSAIRSDSTINYSGKGTIIAIIDSGVNYNHKDMVLDTDFEPKYSKEQWEEKINLLGYGSYISDKIPFAYNYADKNEDVLDSNNTHGYHVSGIASSNGDLMGVAPNSQVVALKFLGKDGQGDTSNLINALEDAVVLGVDVINMSIGSPYGMESKDSIQEKAIKKAADKGILCCAATGNIATTDGLYDFSNKFKLTDTSTVNTPAVVKDTLAVASSNIFMYRKHITTEMSKFSSWGPTNELTIKPEITAPGENILSTLDGTNGYSTQSGTSMATPYISGMASLVLNEVKNKNICSFYNKNQLLQGRELFAFIKNNLMNTAEPIIENEYHNKTYNLPYSVRLQGAGLANIYAAVNNRVIATYNGEAKIELGEVEDSTAFDIILTNYGDKNITYTIKNCEIYQPLTTLDGKYYTDKSALAKIKMADTITVPAYGQAKISCSLEIQDGYLENSFVESYIRFTSDLEDVPNLSMPLLAFYGDWNNEPIIDKSIYDEGLSYLE